MDKQTFQARVEYALNGGMVKRFHSELTLTENTVGQHSFGVAWLAHFLSTHLGTVERYTLLLAALGHDLPEQEFGDVPAPAKREMGIRDLWNDHERDLQHQMGFGYEDTLSDEGRRVLKLADVFDGAFYCCKERALGNRTIVGCFKNFMNYAAEILNRDNQPETRMFEFANEVWERANA